ncbi:gluconate transporter [Flavobacterium akiainvivens]|uniref:Gluconate transporter n=1 Tax=Flavobacterium akiainvivens TaxID=1202724 RepID=A0A0M9VHI8_9FLAO|nr:gluconate:H+ symporter [Flavobacterium akiainvivens]KOS05616.1 gluconate transporter [Flavobacterium akiainvivens]SFQ35420.1 Gnt-I system high-affinity gluconate transporter [Flavobacterium akiainvivens]
MSLLIVIVSVVALLILLITKLKINPFISFLLISIAAGFALGMPAQAVSESVQKGIGGMLGSILVIICIGAMIGKLVAESGAAQVISDAIMKVFGRKYIQWGLLSTGFIIGIPLFYNVGFVLTVPIIFALVYKYKLPAVYIGLPMLAALSVAHGFLPPHPSPAALVTIFQASMGKTLFYGIIIAIPTIIIAGPLFSQTVKNIRPIGGLTTFDSVVRLSVLPSTFNSFFSALLPVFLLAATSTLLLILPEESTVTAVCHFVSDPSILMLIALIVATYTIGLRMGRSIKEIMRIYEEAIKEIAIILLIIGSSGALKQVLVDSGASEQIGMFFSDLHIHPLVLAWLISASIRVCLGSATVAGLTTAGIIAPLMSTFNVDPALMVLAIGSGSLMFSHVNDPGFWMFKEYFNISLKDTFRSWSLMETIVSVAGLVGVLLLHSIIG